MSHISFNNKDNNVFSEIKKVVNDYFSKNHLKRTGNYTVYLKSVLFILLAVISYLVLLFCNFSAWIALPLCVVLGMALAGIGFNVMHDGAHGSYSSKKWLNNLAGFSLNLMGGNVFIWKNKHNFNHHSYTNIEGFDDDINNDPWIRTHINQPKHWYHRYQHIYALFLYGMTYFSWIWAGDFRNYFSKKIATTQLHEMSVTEHFIFWISKIIYFSLFLVIPITQLGFVKTIIGYSVMGFSCGFILGVIFQLAHVIESAAFPSPTEASNKIEQNWVLHQIATTVNFAPRNRAICWLTGGLNFQIVHHIFPKISHIHYPEINKLIRGVCEKFNIRYTEYPTFWSALSSHISHLRHIGAH